MRKQIVVGLSAGALLAALLPGVASASDLGCPPGANHIPKPVADNMGEDEEFEHWEDDGYGWVLLEVENAIPGVDRGNYLDRNGDGLICKRFALGVSKQVEVNAFVAKDNKLPED